MKKKTKMEISFTQKNLAFFILVETCKMFYGILTFTMECKVVGGIIHKWQSGNEVWKNDTCSQKKMFFLVKKTNRQFQKNTKNKIKKKILTTLFLYCFGLIFMKSKHKIQHNSVNGFFQDNIQRSVVPGMTASDGSGQEKTDCKPLVLADCSQNTWNEVEPDIPQKMKKVKGISTTEQKGKDKRLNLFLVCCVRSRAIVRAFSRNCSLAQVFPDLHTAPEHMEIKKARQVKMCNWNVCSAWYMPKSYVSDARHVSLISCSLKCTLPILVRDAHKMSSTAGAAFASQSICVMLAHHPIEQQSYEPRRLHGILLRKFVVPTQTICDFQRDH